MQALEKPLPSNLEAEKTILGAVFIDNDLMSSAAEQLTAEDFYSPFHQQVFSGMLALYSESRTIEVISVCEYGKKQGIEIPASRVAELVYGLPVLTDLDTYIDIVLEKSKARRFIRACNAGVVSAASEAEPIHEVMDKVEQNLYDLRSTSVGRMEQLGDIVMTSVSEVAERSKSGLTMLGLPTGFKQVDALTGGLQKTDLIILAARPSMGKSAFSLDICKGVTDSDSGAVVAYFSLEMSKKQCADRLVCSMAEVDSSRYRIGMLGKGEWDEVFKAAEMLRERKVHIDDSPALSVFDIKSKARHIAVREGRLDLIVIDYLQLMRGTRKTDSRQQEVSDISRELKALAKDMGVPIIALSQLSRSCESRQDKRPLLSDLRESGAIEQDADIVAFLYRDEYYNEPTPDTAGKAELIFRKHRHGATDTVTLAFIKRFAKFANNYV